MKYEFNTIEDCINIIEKRNDIPYEIKTEIEDIWFDILMDEYYEDDFRIEQAIKKLNDFVNKEEKKMKYYVMCRRNGIESILKSNGIEQYFDTIEQAQEKAKKMRELVSSADYFVETMEEKK